MARKRNRVPLNVYLNGRLTGQLRRETSGAIDFQYDPTWLEWEHTFPISLSLPLREDRYVGDPVIAVFDNLLPDNEDIRRRVAARTGADGADAYSLLATIGRDCVGALLYLNNAWHIPHGSTATTHIIKPQNGRRADVDLTQSVENDFFCMQLFFALGLPTALTEIPDFDDQRALVVERFDRRWTRDDRLLRLPQENCCQALLVRPSRKYQSDGGPGIVDILEFLK
jgi:serine/threonine-protein kinase HipA